MSADPTNSRAAFEAAWETVVNVLRECSGDYNSPRFTDRHGTGPRLKAAITAHARLLALYDQAAQSAAAVAPDAAVEGVVGWASHALAQGSWIVKVPDDWPTGTRVRITRLPEPAND